MNKAREEGGGKHEVRRELKLADVYAISAGAMISSGFFLLPGAAIIDTGASLVLAYLLASVAIIPAAMSIAELSTAMPKDGGAYYLLDRSLGRLAGTVTGIGTWAQLVLKSAFALVGLGAYLALLTDLPIEPVAIGMTVVFMGVNLWGTRETGLAQKLLVYGIVAVISFFIVQGLAFALTGEAYASVPDRFDPFLTGGWLGLLSSTGMVFVAYTGLTKIASVAEEIERPERNIPLGTFLAWSTATGLYILGSFVIVVAVGPIELAGDDTPVASAAEALMGWLPGSLGVLLVTLAALAAFASTAIAGLMSASRYGLAMGRDEVVHTKIAHIGSRGTPTVSIVLTSVAMIVAILVLDVERLAKLASAFQLMIFALLCIAVAVMRYAGGDAYRPSYKTPFFPLPQILGVLIYAVLIAAMGLLPALASIALAAIGAAWYFFSARATRHENAGIHELMRRWRRSGR